MEIPISLNGVKIMAGWDIGEGEIYVLDVRCWTRSIRSLTDAREAIIIENAL